MKSKIVISCLVVLLSSVGGVLASGGFDHGEHSEKTVVKEKMDFAAEHGEAVHEEHEGSMMEHQAQAEEGLVYVGNKICPVSGQPVDAMGGLQQFEYNGKVYNLCCKMCEKDFKQNPEKFSKIADESVKQEIEEGHGDGEEAVEESEEPQE